MRRNRCRYARPGGVGSPSECPGARDYRGSHIRGHAGTAGVFQPAGTMTSGSPLPGAPARGRKHEDAKWKTTRSSPPSRPSSWRSSCRASVRRSEERRVGKSVSVRVDLGGRRILKNNTKTKKSRKRKQNQVKANRKQ